MSDIVQRSASVCEFKKAFILALLKASDDLGLCVRMYLVLSIYSVVKKDGGASANSMRESFATAC